MEMPFWEVTFILKGCAQQRGGWGQFSDGQWYWEDGYLSRWSDDGRRVPVRRRMLIFGVFFLKVVNLGKDLIKLCSLGVITL